LFAECKTNYGHDCYSYAVLLY